MKLSVIIPVYRAAATLNRCVESVLSQAVNGLEVILVDDGSPDACPQLCDAWQLREARVCVIHQSNRGLSAARNAGLDIAQGDYVTFVDADDYLSPHTYQPLLDEMGDADLLEYAIPGRLKPDDRTYTDMSAYWLESQAYLHTYACNKIYRRELFASVRFPEGKVFEDAYTLPLLLRQVRLLKTTSKGSYHYCDNPQGLTATARGRELAMLLEAHLQSQMPIDDRYYLHLLNIQMDVFELTGAEPVLPLRRLNPAGFKGVEKLKAHLLNLLGINRICKLNTFIHRLWRSH